MTIPEIQLRIKGVRNNKEFQLQNTRLMMWASAAPHTSKKIEPEDLLRLESDSENVVANAPVSDEKYNKVMKQMKDEYDLRELQKCKNN